MSCEIVRMAAVLDAAGRHLTTAIDEAQHGIARCLDGI